MTKAERDLINKALRWLAADRTETEEYEDNFAECGPFDELVSAIEQVSLERGKSLQDYYDPEPLREFRRKKRLERENEMSRKRKHY